MQCTPPKMSPARPCWQRALDAETWTRLNQLFLAHVVWVGQDCQVCEVTRVRRKSILIKKMGSNRSEEGGVSVSKQPSLMSICTKFMRQKVCRGFVGSRVVKM